MAKSCRSAACVAVLTMLLPWPGVAAQALPAATDVVKPDFTIQIVGDTFAGFTVRVDRYFELRSQLERGLPPRMVTDDVRQIIRGTRSLATAIRLARPGAVQGEFFTDETGIEFRRVLALIMTATVWAVIMDENPGTFMHKIDGSYPEGKTHATMPGNVLARVPHLPDDIEFRFLGPHLILYDVRANIIIDQLPDAIECVNRCDQERRQYDVR